jgi:hypothetical protein
VQTCRIAATATAAVLGRDPLLCAEAGEPHLRRLCERVARGEPGRSIHCPTEDGACHALAALSRDVCLRWWGILGNIPASRGFCAWTVLLDALRGEPVEACHHLPLVLQGLCRAVTAGDPEGCPPPDAGDPGVILAGRCRQELVRAPGIPVLEAPYGNGVILSLPVVNPFADPASCRFTVRLRAGAVVVARAVSDSVEVPASSGYRPSPLTVLRFRMAPAPAGLEVLWEPSCTWAGGEGLRPRGDGLPVVD